MIVKSTLKFLIGYISFFLAFILIIFTIISIKNNIEKDYLHDQVLNDTASDKYPTIIIDAGHGGEDGGTIGITGVYEKDINLSLAMDLYSLFKASDFPVILTRDKDILLYDTNVDYYGKKKILDLAKRYEIASKYENSIFISIHQNAFSDSKYSGLQVYYSKNDPLSYELASEIQVLVKNTLQNQNDRNIKPSNGIYLLEKITSPAILIECGFLSNETECKLLQTKEYQKQLTAVIYSAILSYFEKTYNF